MRIAIIDYKIIPTNPIGGCHLRLLEGLCRDHEFTVFAVEFQNPCPEHIRWVRIPTPRRPQALLFVVFHLLAAAYFARERLLRRQRFDLVQKVESNFGFGTVAYAQFCHRAYLRNHWRQSRAPGPRGWLRWLDHRLHALLEPWVYRRVQAIVVASQGLARELVAEYPFTAGKIRVIPNPVDLDRMRPPADFGRDGWRQRLEIAPTDTALTFVALGHFERKGLPILLEALTRIEGRRPKLVVVGGTVDLVKAYRTRVRQARLDDTVVFVGQQQDVRPYLWAADAFVLPSFYEVFPLVALEAAAASLPLIVTPLYGVEEFVRSGEHGLVVERSPDGMAAGVSAFLALPREAQRALGNSARRDVAQYATANFVSAWRAFYAGMRAGHVA